MRIALCPVCLTAILLLSKALVTNPLASEKVLGWYVSLLPSGNDH